MSEAVQWPVPNSAEEFGSDKAEPKEADVIPFPNRTGLIFNKVTEQEIVDYIGHTANYMGAKLNLVWSEDQGLCFSFERGEDIDNFDCLLSLFEEEQAGGTWNRHNPSASALLCLEELPEEQEVFLPSRQDGRLSQKVLADDKTFYLTSHWALRSRLEGEKADEIAAKEKVIKYDFADFLIRKHQEGWQPE